MSTSMQVLIPLGIDDATLVSSSVAEDDHGEWSNVTTYALGDRVISTSAHRIYESLQNGNTNHAPLTDDGTWWVDAGPTNRWAMFDESVGTATAATDSIVVVLEPATQIGGLVLLGSQAAQMQVQIERTSTSELVYSATVSLDSFPVGDWYEYLTAPIQFNSDAVLTDFPVVADPRITVTITKSGDVSVGSLVLGSVHQMGAVQYGMQLGIVDYSRKETDAFGATTLVQRAYSRKVDLSMVCDQTTLNGIYALLSNLRARAVVWIPTASAGYEASIVYGWYRDFSIDVATPSAYYCTLQIEGLT